MYHYPAITVDIAVLNWIDSTLKLLLIQRKNDPYKNRWALPGGFIELDETLVESAARELEEETGLKGLTLEQIGTFGDPGRDPRGRTLTVLYRTIVTDFNQEVQGMDDAKDARWYSLNELPELAFDHSQIISYLKKSLHHDLNCSFNSIPELNQKTHLELKQWLK